MYQEISASTIFKVVEILIIGSLLVLLPGNNGVLRNPSKHVGIEVSEESLTTVQVVEAVESEQ